MDLTHDEKKQVRDVIKHVATGYIARNPGEHDPSSLQSQLRVSISPALALLGESLWTSASTVVMFVWAEDPDPDGLLKDMSPCFGVGETLGAAASDLKSKMGTQWDGQYGTEEMWQGE